MSRKLIEKYSHTVGSHCTSAALRDIFDFFGFNFSEELIFGLGCGLGFVYFKYKEIPYYYINGRNENLEILCSKFLSISIKKEYPPNLETGWQQIKELLDQNIPIMFTADMNLLPYIRNSVELWEDYPFGRHQATLIGYDDEKQIVWISDHAWANWQILPLKQFFAAWSSPIKPLSPEMCWYKFSFPEKLIPIEIALRNSLYMQVQQMLYPWGKLNNYTGILGLQKLSREIWKWNKIFDKQKLKLACHMAYNMLERIGTGGGNFRRIYSRFLIEASKILKEDFSFAINNYIELSQLWKKMSNILKQVSEEKVELEILNDFNFQKLVNEIVKREEESILFLGKKVGI